MATALLWTTLMARCDNSFNAEKIKNSAFLEGKTGGTATKNYDKIIEIYLITISTAAYYINYEC